MKRNSRGRTAAAPRTARGVRWTCRARSASQDHEALLAIGTCCKARVAARFAEQHQGPQAQRLGIQRLRIGDVDSFIKRAQAGSFSTFDIYAEMTGFPAAVHRGLVDEDGDEIGRGTGTFMRSRIALSSLPGYRASEA